MSDKLLPGMKTPPLRVPTVGGGTFDLHATEIDKFLIVDVYRGLHCPRCHRHLLDMNSKVGHLKRRGVGTLAVSMDGQERAAEAKERWGLGFLDVGYGLTLDDAAAWNLFTSTAIGDSEARVFAEPAVFLITPDHALHSAIYGTSPFNRFSYADMLEAVDTIIARDYPPRGTLDPASAKADT